MHDSEILDLFFPQRCVGFGLWMFVILSRHSVTLTSHKVVVTPTSVYFDVPGSYWSLIVVRHTQK